MKRKNQFLKELVITIKVKKLERALFYYDIVNKANQTARGTKLRLIFINIYNGLKSAIISDIINIYLYFIGGEKDEFKLFKIF